MKNYVDRGGCYNIFCLVLIFLLLYCISNYKLSRSPNWYGVSPKLNTLIKFLSLYLSRCQLPCCSQPIWCSCPHCLLYSSRDNRGNRGFYDAQVYQISCHRHGVFGGHGDVQRLTNYKLCWYHRWQSHKDHSSP